MIITDKVYESGYRAGRVKTFILCAVLLGSFLGGRYGRNIELPVAQSAQAAESPFEACSEIDCIEIPSKPEGEAWVN